ncbi:MAG: hypothetical protein HYV06_07735 [Deltaproteobacteria bacterium]|nr:hypothetical protein [Deltaproteobacteria bacterium]
MAMAALSPSSILATPIQVNSQVRNDLQTSVPQVAQDAQKTAKSAQTDTITISAQALKMAGDENSIAKEKAKKTGEQEVLQMADDKIYDEKKATQKKAVEAYAAASANR